MLMPKRKAQVQWDVWKVGYDNRVRLYGSAD